MKSNNCLNQNAKRNGATKRGLALFTRVAMWLVWNVPLGRAAPYVLGLAIGAKPCRVPR
jgi:hypothetical protein